MSEHAASLNCRISSELNRLLEAERKERNISRTDVVIEALKKHLVHRGEAVNITASPENRMRIKHQAQYILFLSKSDCNYVLWEKIQREVEKLWAMIQE